MTDDELSLALSVLSRGGIVAVATETFFGLLVDPKLAGALDALFALKGRQAEKGVALLVPGQEAWRTLVEEIPPLAETLARRFWPGPLTIALAARADLDPRLTVDGTVGARCPGASDAARIVAAYGAPLTATSANLAGSPACLTSDEVERAFPEALAVGRRSPAAQLTIDRRSPAAPLTVGALALVPGVAPGGAPSTLVVVTGGGIRVVRSGQIRESDLLSLVPSSSLR